MRYRKRVTSPEKPLSFKYFFPVNTCVCLYVFIFSGPNSYIEFSIYLSFFLKFEWLCLLKLFLGFNREYQLVLYSNTDLFFKHVGILIVLFGTYCDKVV